MNEIEQYHNKAMEFAELAEVAKIKGDAGEVPKLLRKAYESERKAAFLVRDIENAEPTRSVLFRSAASLAIECNEISEAENLIRIGLSGNPPAEIAEGLMELQNKVYSKLRVNSGRGVYNGSIIPTRRYFMPTEYSHVAMLITQIYLTKTRDADKKSEVYIVGAVAAGIGKEPLQVQSLIFKDVKPLNALPITGDGFAIYRNTPGELPDNLDYAIAIMESDAGYRDAGELIEQVTGSDDFASLKSQIGSAVTPSGALMDIAFSAIRIAAGLLKANADDPLLKTVGSVNRGLGYQLKGKPLTKVESPYAAMHFGVSLW